MSGRLRYRQAANAASKIEENVNERILSECHALYADPKNGETRMLPVSLRTIMRGVSDYLSTEISTSREKRFGLVTFIDTPGLVDGDMKYEFDVERALLWLGDQVDLVFVFFDPMGQALCKRTLNIVERLSEENGEKMRFYLSKADEAGDESDRQVKISY
ncbi:UNVERIFIED_CONTAM: hypothetical protein FKN15_068303 [Acipenser sinensis]